MKRSLYLIPLLVLLLALSACANSPTAGDTAQTDVPVDSSTVEEQGEAFVETFSQTYPTFALLDYAYGSEETAPIQCVAIAEDLETGVSSTLFILDDNGVVGQVVLASGYTAMYRAEDGLQIDKNVISLSLDLIQSDASTEIHDYQLTVTKEEDEGVLGTVYTNQETIRTA